MNTYLKLYIILILTLVLISCGSIPKIVKTSYPADPIMLPVHVKGGIIQGKDLDNTIKNHKKLWEHIHLIKSLSGNSTK